jgi:hypothetical protein
MFVFQYTWLVGASSPNFESSIHDTHFAKNEKKTKALYMTVHDSRSSIGNALHFC